MATIKWGPSADDPEGTGQLNGTTVQLVGAATVSAALFADDDYGRAPNSASYLRIQGTNSQMWMRCRTETAQAGLPVAQVITFHVWLMVETSNLSVASLQLHRYNSAENTKIDTVNVVALNTSVGNPPALTPTHYTATVSGNPFGGSMPVISGSSLIDGTLVWGLGVITTTSLALRQVYTAYADITLTDWPTVTGGLTALHPTEAITTASGQTVAETITPTETVWIPLPPVVNDTLHPTTTASVMVQSQGKAYTGGNPPRRHRIDEPRQA